MANKNFEVKHGLSVGGTERITSAGAGSFTDLTLSGDLNITGDVNSVSVTDLDVTDKTITLGKGQTESNSGGSGIVIDGSSASMLWDESNGEFDFNNPLSIVNSIGGDTVLNLTGSYGSGNNVALLGFARAGGAVSGDIRYVDASTDMEIGTGTAHAFSLKTSGTRRVKVHSDGKVDVGGSGGLYGLLTVTQKSGADTDEGGIGIVDSSNGRSLRLYCSSTTSFINSGNGGGGNLVLNEGSGKVGIGTSAPNQVLDVQGNIRIPVAQSIRAEDDDGTYRGAIRLANTSTYNLDIFMQSDGSNPAFTIQNSDRSIGIGETSPDKQLHIKDSGNVGIAIESTDNAQNLDIDFYNNGGSAAGRIRYAEGPGAFGFAPNVSADDALYIKYSGEVGIGTTNPQYKLVISNGGASSIELGPAYSGTANLIQSYNRSGSAYVHTVYDAAVHRFNIAGNEKFQIDSSGHGLFKAGVVEIDSGGTSGTSMIKLTNDNERCRITGNYDTGGGGRLGFWTDTSGGTLVQRLTIDNDGQLRAINDAGVSYNWRGGPATNTEALSASEFEIVREKGSFRTNVTSNTEWRGMAGSHFYAKKSGQVRMVANMYISSGAYYFKWRVKDQQGNVVFDSYNDRGTVGNPSGGSFGNYEYPTGQTGNVHYAKTYSFNVAGIIAGRTYHIEMAPSNSAGSVTYSNQQQTFLREFKVFTSAPADGSYSFQLKKGYYGHSTGGTNYEYEMGGFQHYADTGDPKNWLGTFTLRNGYRYLDLALNINSNSYMFYAYAEGYLYNQKIVNTSCCGYMYTSNNILAKATVNNGNGNNGFMDPYRSTGQNGADTGQLCLKLDRTTTGYSEGNIHIFFGGHSPKNDVIVTNYSQNNSSGNHY